MFVCLFLLFFYFILPGVGAETETEEGADEGEDHGDQTGGGHHYKGQDLHIQADHRPLNVDQILVRRNDGLVVLVKRGGPGDLPKIGINAFFSKYQLVLENSKRNRGDPMNFEEK